MARPVLICIHRGDFGYSRLRQYGQVDKTSPNSFGVIAEVVEEHHYAEEAFRMLADDTRSMGVLTTDGEYLIVNGAPLGAFPAQLNNIKRLFAHKPLDKKSLPS